jgi:hypothetical protein
MIGQRVSAFRNQPFLDYAGATERRRIDDFPVSAETPTAGESGP